MLNILVELQDIIFDNGEVYRSKENDNSYGKAYYINFTHFKENTKSTIDYWMPIFEEKFPDYYIVSLFYSSLCVTLWFKYSIKKHRKLKLNKIDDNKK